MSKAQQTNIEPEAIEFPGEMAEKIILSQAISLKRIADRLDELTDWRYDEPAIRTIDKATP